MAGLVDKRIKDSYKSVLRLDRDEGLNGATLIQVEDGAGVNSALYLATDSVLVSGNATKLYFYDADGGESIKADNAGVLTINSGADLNLTCASGDINIPANIGLTFGDDGEKIEGNGTDLTIASSRGIQIGHTTSTVTGTRAISLGAANTIAGVYSIAAGVNCTNAGGYSFTQGRYCDTTASKNYAFASGRYAVSTNYGQMTRASGRFATIGDAQHSTYILRNRSTDATDVELFLNGSDERFVIPQDCTLIFWGYVLGRDTNHAGESFGYKIEGILSRAGSGNPALLEAATVTMIYEENAVVDPVISIDTTNDSLKIVCDGRDSRNWVAVVHTLEVIGQD